MHPTINHRPRGARIAVTRMKPLLLHDVTHSLASARAAARRHLAAIQPFSRSADHARRPVARPAQS